MNTTNFSTHRGWAWLSLCLAAIPWNMAPAQAAETPAATSASPQLEADQLLALARRAISEGNLEIAGSYLTRAESLQPKYPVYHLGETPQKIRGDLQKLQATAAAKAPASLPTTQATAINRAASPGSYPVQQAGGAMPTTSSAIPSYYTANTDQTRVQLAQNTAPAPQSGLLLGNPAGSTPALTMPATPAIAPLPPAPATQPNVNLLVRQETLPPGKSAGTINPPVMPATMPAPSPSASAPMTPYGMPGITQPAQATEPAPNKAQGLLNAGEKALQEGQMDAALKSFREAYTLQSELDGNARSR